MNQVCEPQFALFDRSLDFRFGVFDRQNPRIYELFVKFAREARERGRSRIGAKMIAERIRWYTQIESNGDEFKINNSFVSRYARKVAQEHPDLSELFELRELRS